MSKIKLRDVAELITKGTTPTTVGGEFCKSGINFIKSESIAGSKYLNSEIFEKIDEKTDKKLKRSRLEKDDLLFSIAGAYLGKIAIIRESDIPANTNQAVGIVRLKKDIVDKDYVYYFYSQKHINTYINKLSSQSSQPNLNLDLLGKLPFDLKRLKDQQQIAAVLSALDAKIELNNRINAELEAMAKTLYDYWFVQFDFPDQNGRPYKSSGGKMVYNPTLKREIPVGWHDSSILAIADLLGGGTPTKKRADYWNGLIPFFTPTDADGTIFKFATADYITGEGLKGSSTRLFDEHTIFITARGSVGRIVLAGVKMAMNQSCYALTAKSGISYSYLFFISKELIHHLQVKSSGSVFDSIVSNDIELTKLAIPDVNLIEKFARIVEPSFKCIANNTLENRQLTQLRDWVLPMLMNGQVTVA